MTSLGAHTIRFSEIDSNGIFKYIKELPLLFVVSVLAWSQYSVLVSLGIKYLILTRQLYFLSFLILLPFECTWILCTWSLVCCVTWGPGWVDITNGGEEGVKDYGSDEGGGDEYDGMRDGDEGIQAPLLRPGEATTSSTRSSTSLPPYPIRSRSHSRRSEDSNSDSDEPIDNLMDALNSTPVGAGPPRPTTESLMCKGDGSRRYCRKCNVFKADRSHHCSSCERCVLKMDHHCPWIGGRCVGHHNHKAFLLFILYTTLLALVTAISAGKGLSDFVSSNTQNQGFELAPLNWAFLLLLGGLFTMALGGFTSYHWYLVSKNRTTIENMERSLRVRPTSNASSDNPVPAYALMRAHRPLGSSLSPHPNSNFPPQSAPSNPDDAVPDYGLPVYKGDDVLTRSERRKLEKAAAKMNVWDLGVWENWREVMGRESRWWEWALPIRPRGVGNGFHFRVNQRNLVKLRELTAEVRLMPPERSSELRYERPN